MVQIKSLFVIISSIIILLLTSGYILFQVSKSRTFQFFGGITHRVNTNEKVIALTFDDAPTKYSDEVVGILEEKGVKATFYTVGQNIEKSPDKAKNIVAHGHELGNHSYSHQRFLLKSFSFVELEIQKTNELIRNVGYKGEITFRPPNGKKLISLPLYLYQHNIKTITWDVEPDTYLPNNINEDEKVKFLVNYTISNTKPGSIILLHPLCTSCTSGRQALREIIDKLQSNGYKFLTISELLTYDRQD